MQKYLLLLTFVAFGLVYQSNAMDTMSACKLLGVHPFANKKAIKKAYDSKATKTTLPLADLNKAYHRLEAIAEARKNGSRLQTVSSKRTGIFTKHLQQREFLQNGDWLFNHTVEVNVYDYKRIFGTFGLFGATAAGLAYWYRNEIASNMASLLKFATSELPSLSKRS